MAATLPVCLVLSALALPLVRFVYGEKWVPAASALSVLAALGAHSRIGTAADDRRPRRGRARAPRLPAAGHLAGGSDPRRWPSAHGSTVCEGWRSPMWHRRRWAHAAVAPVRAASAGHLGLGPRAFCGASVDLDGAWQGWWPSRWPRSVIAAISCSCSSWDSRRCWCSSSVSPRCVTACAPSPATDRPFLAPTTCTDHAQTIALRAPHPALIMRVWRGRSSTGAGRKPFVHNGFRVGGHCQTSPLAWGHGSGERGWMG